MKTLKGKMFYLAKARTTATPHTRYNGTTNSEQKKYFLYVWVPASVPVFYSPIIAFEFLFFATLCGGFGSFCGEGKFLDFPFFCFEGKFWFPSVGGEGKFWFPWG